MSKGDPKALLPAGLRDLLPPEAAREAALVDAILGVCASWGYERVKPPLVEFDESLAGGEAAFDIGRAFRMMDPVSNRMMGVRADMTMQVARIATTRLVKSPRPVRLCYSGEVLRSKGTQLSPERQFCQVGVELIGAGDSAAGDAEVVLLAAAALDAAGIGSADLSIDLSQPTLVPALAEALGITGKPGTRLRAALDRKDAAAVAAVEAETRAEGRFAALLAASGPAQRALEALAALDLPAAAAAEAARLAEVAELILAARPDLRLTVDPVENRGFEYHTGVTFTIFADGVRGELGSGGRYHAASEDSDIEAERGEPATGFTLFTNVLLRAAAETEPARRVFLPLGTPGADAAGLRAEGWITVAGLMPTPGDGAEDDRAEARRLQCSHYLAGGKPAPVKT